MMVCDEEREVGGGRASGCCACALEDASRFIKRSIGKEFKVEWTDWNGSLIGSDRVEMNWKVSEWIGIHRI